MAWSHDPGVLKLRFVQWLIDYCLPMTECENACDHLRLPSLAAEKQSQWSAAFVQGSPAHGAELPASTHGCRVLQCIATPRPAHDASGLLLAITTARQQPCTYGGPDGAQHVRGHGHGQR